MKKRASESKAHYALKWKAFEWLWKQGYRHIAFECELHGLYPDILAVKNCVQGRTPEVIAIESKASYSDFLKDADAEKHIARAESKLKPLRAEYSKLVAVAPGYGEAYTAHRKQLRELGKKISPLRQVAGRRSKFNDPLYLSHTTRRYIIAPAGIIPANEVPEGWGLLDETPGVVVKPPRVTHKLTLASAIVVLREISRVHTQAALKENINPEWVRSKPRFPDYLDLLERL